MVQYEENVPVGWSIKQIKDIAPLQRGFDLPAKELVYGEYPVCYSNGVGNYHNEYKVKGPGVFTGRSGTIGNVFFVEEDFWPHNTSLWVTDFKGSHEKYVYYLYQSIKLNRFNAGTGVPTLNRNDVHAYRALIPNSVKEQKNITKILETWDKVIELKEKLIEQKKEQKKGLMKKLLTGEVRLAGFNSRWETVSLNEIVSKVIDNRGKTPPLSKKGLELIEVNALTPNNKFPNYKNVTKYVDTETYNSWFRNGHPEKGDILVATVGSVGSTAIMEENRGCIAQNIVALKIKEDYDSEFIYYWMNSDKYYNLIKKVLMGAVQPSIKVPHLLKFVLSVPSKEEQVQIANVISMFDRELFLLQKEVNSLKLQKKSLMQQLLTGKIRVKV